MSRSSFSVIVSTGLGGTVGWLVGWLVGGGAGALGALGALGAVPKLTGWDAISRRACPWSSARRNTDARENDSVFDEAVTGTASRTERPSPRSFSTFRPYSGTKSSKNMMVMFFKMYR